MILLLTVGVVELTQDVDRSNEWRFISEKSVSGIFAHGIINVIGVTWMMALWWRDVHLYNQIHCSGVYIISTCLLREIRH